MGEGLFHSFARLHVGPQAEVPAWEKEDTMGWKREWELHALVPGEGYVGALAVARPCLDLTCWNLSPETLVGLVGRDRQDSQCSTVQR